MTLQERSELYTGFLRLQADLACLQRRCHELGALQLGVSVHVAKNAIDEACEDFKPDATPYVSHRQVEPKH